MITCGGNKHKLTFSWCDWTTESETADPQTLSSSHTKKVETFALTIQTVHLALSLSLSALRQSHLSVLLSSIDLAAKRLTVSIVITADIVLPSLYLLRLSGHHPSLSDKDYTLTAFTEIRQFISADLDRIKCFGHCFY
ncbi:hypothetical protein BASA62_001456 [Batrachochytrium salamandrivorans]|nr:hypothetical protein BASA62_001456 [Batrachochytrium salamandrivorans]